MTIYGGDFAKSNILINDKNIPFKLIQTLKAYSEKKCEIFVCHNNEKTYQNIGT